jgi:hypothetical protein
LISKKISLIREEQDKTSSLAESARDTKSKQIGPPVALKVKQRIPLSKSPKGMHRKEADKTILQFFYPKIKIILMVSHFYKILTIFPY